jgi:outer membrane receptor for ferrienterochelin and colicin
MVGKRLIDLGILILCISTIPALAQIFGTVRVVVRDPQNLAVTNAQVILRAKNSERMQTASSNSEGIAVIPAVPIGDYRVSVSAPGFATAKDRDIQVTSDKVTPLQIQLAVEGVEQSVSVTDTVAAVNPESSTTENLTNRSDIVRTPDADRTGSLAMITDNVPGAFVMHDHLHSRGGHGITWEIDGVPVPNSNLATVGSQFDPKDVDYLEIQRGGLGSNYGDRSYGVFNVVPRSGFEGTKFGEFLASYGNYNQTNEYMNFGSHTNRFAYYGSLSGSRTDRGLERVDIPILHDQSASFSGFTSMLFNPTTMNQLRFVASSRRDHYQVPNTVVDQAKGIRDVEIASDTFTNVTWVHTGSNGTLLTISPYYHFNRGQYVGGPNDPIVTSDNRGSHYIGGYVNFEVTRGKHSIRLGTDTFHEHDNQSFGITDNTLANPLSVQHQQTLTANVESVFAEDSFKVTRWLTLNDGLRFERFSGTLDEHAVSPRLGAAINAGPFGVFRGSYSRYYQHPQVSTVAGPILEFAARQGFSFLPIPGERDEIWEVGWAIPIHGWTLDFDRFHNRTKNAVDHDVLGHSSLLLPLTIERGRVRAYESTLRSPLLFKRLKLHYNFSYMTAQGAGRISGGLTDFLPPPHGFFFLDHDQRVTFTAGSEITLPERFWFSDNVIYGSGFLRGNGPDHMPHHTTFDLSLGKDIGENVSLRISALNVADKLFLTGIDNSFAGTHYYAPREITAQLRYRFHY